IKPGISCSARRIWCRPAVASERSATLKAREVDGAVVTGAVMAPSSQARLRITCSGAGRELLDDGMAHDLPALRHREALRVPGAQVVAVRLGAEAQRPEHGHRVGVV